MIQRSVEVLFFGGIVPIGFLFFYSLSQIMDNPSEEDIIRYVTILMFLVLVFAILLVLFLFRERFARNYGRDRIIGLVGKKVYSTGGDYVGVVKDVLLGQNKIYGLKVLLDSGKNKKKIVLLSKNIRQYSDVVLVDSTVLEKAK